MIDDVGRVEEFNITKGSGEVRFVIIGDSGEVCGILDENTAKDLEFNLPEHTEINGEKL